MGLDALEGFYRFLVDYVAPYAISGAATVAAWLPIYMSFRRDAARRKAAEGDEDAKLRDSMSSRVLATFSQHDKDDLGLRGEILDLKREVREGEAARARAEADLRLWQLAWWALQITARQLRADVIEARRVVGFALRPLIEAGQETAPRPSWIDAAGHALDPDQLAPPPRNGEPPQP